MRRIAVVAALLALLGRADASAQQRVLPVRVEYIAGRNVYLSGAPGIAAGDTLEVRRAREGASAGRMRVIATATEHVVVTFAGTPFALTLGDSLWVTGGRPVAPAAPAARAAPASLTARPTAPALLPARASLPRHVRITGRLSLDLDALASHPGQAAPDRTLYTPGVRLRAMATDLPAGLRADISARYAHPSGTRMLAPEPSMRIYRAVLETAAYDAPVRLRVGRFANEHDPFSGYWDGMLVRAGSRAAGVGFTAGFEPVLGNQGFSGAVRKYGAFADAAVRAGATGWSLNVAAVVRDGEEPHRPGRTIGAAQTFRVGPFRTRQRIQVAGGDGIAWELAHAEIDAALRVTGPLSLRGFASERRFGAGTDTAFVTRARRRVGGGGFLIVGRDVTFMADVSLTTWDARSPATSWSAMLLVPRSRLAGIGFGANVTHTVQADQRTLLVAPRLSRAFGRTRVSGSYQYYATLGAGLDARSSAFDVSLAFPLGARLEADLRARVQRGPGLTTERLYATLSMTL